MNAAIRIIRVGQIVLSVTDLAASRYFYVGLLGLNVLDESRDALYLRGVEDREWTLKLHLAPEPGVRHIGFKVASDADLDLIAAMAARDALPHRWETELDRPRMLRIQDPFGFPVVFYYQSVKHPWLLQRFDLQRGAGLQRIDHCNVFSTDVAAITRWYRDTLGFRLSEYSEDGARRVWATWLHTKGHSHDLALTNGRGPKLHHFAYWMPDSMKITLACDILAGAHEESRIERGPGRHGISNALFLYLRDPDGHRIELYTGDYLTVDPDFEPICWNVNDARRQQLWGGIAPASWFLEGSAVEGFDGDWVTQQDAALSGLPAYVR